jgi:phage protein|nr:MAG TPA: tail assembly chaperone [Caudoviricetes sp.]DAS97821.1 MAG TPA: tail assembly chaperone [Bacteriophage sp.]
MTLRTQLLSRKPQITPITLMGENYYLKSLSVGELNRQLFEQRQALIVLAQKANIELPEHDSEQFDEALEKFAQQYQLPRAMASRLCDENGELLFDPENIDDLNQITELDSQLIADFNQAVAALNPKKLASEESSN